MSARSRPAQPPFVSTSCPHRLRLLCLRLVNTHAGQVISWPAWDMKFWLRMPVGCHSSTRAIGRTTGSMHAISRSLLVSIQVCCLQSHTEMEGRKQVYQSFALAMFSCVCGRL
jgi:hypothetical protein